MSQNYFQIIIDLLFPKDKMNLDLSNSNNFGDKEINDLGICIWVATEYNNSVVHDLIHRIKVNKEFTFAAADFTELT